MFVYSSMVGDSLMAIALFVALAFTVLPVRKRPRRET